ncbi:MAG: CDP-glucose 4,6-dehydratase [Gammaproteobacteria bacterium]|nr:CDP-glucose 4,6-dehydratase [Gammaproteobacteria bacterium]
MKNDLQTFWRGKKVFLTGHTGFKGSWLALWLQHMGAEVYGYALAPEGEVSLFAQARVAEGMQSLLADISDAAQVAKTMQAFQPDIVIHMAAQSLVRHSYQYPLDTYQTNVMGTANVLDAVRHTPSVRAVVNITSDKCYANREMIWGYRENEPMGGFDPYSSSKGCAELVADAYRNSFFMPAGIGLASARAGNVIGGGDWAVDRLVPDVMRACIAQQNVVLRFPHAVRPWQHVLEPLMGYLQLARLLYIDPIQYSQGWNFGPNQQKTHPVGWIAEHLLQFWGGPSVVEYEAQSQPHEAQSLVLDSTKANSFLHWSPRWALEDALKNIVAWHKVALVEDDMRAFTLQQIDQYLETTEERNEVCQENI